MAGSRKGPTKCVSFVRRHASQRGSREAHSPLRDTSSLSEDLFTIATAKSARLRRSAAKAAVTDRTCCTFVRAAFLQRCTLLTIDFTVSGELFAPLPESRLGLSLKTQAHCAIECGATDAHFNASTRMPAVPNMVRSALMNRTFTHLEAFALSRRSCFRSFLLGICGRWARRALICSSNKVEGSPIRGSRPGLLDTLDKR